MPIFTLWLESELSRHLVAPCINEYDLFTFI